MTVESDDMFLENMIVQKRNTRGEEVWRYSGEVLEADPEKLVLQAYFDRPDSIFHGMPLHTGDRFVETYYTSRWYNIFEIHAREDDSLRGWYCNVACPAVINDRELSYVDLALDLMVFPDGRQLVLDEDEFAALDIDEKHRRQALAALAELQAFFRAR